MNGKRGKGGGNGGGRGSVGGGGGGGDDKVTLNLIVYFVSDSLLMFIVGSIFSLSLPRNTVARS